MFPAPIPLTDDITGQPVLSGNNMVFVTPMMDQSGIFPLIDQTGQVVIYPKGMPMIGSNGQPVYENGHPIIIYYMLDSH